MSDTPQGPGWWQASDGRWYPPEQFTGTPPADQTTGPATWSPDAVYQPQNPYGPAPYGQVGYGYGAMPPKNESLAVASLVLGICSLLCCYLGLPLGVIGLVTGYVARKRIDESNGLLTGQGLALAGMICGGIGVGISAAWYLMIFVGLATSPS